MNIRLIGQFAVVIWMVWLPGRVSGWATQTNAAAPVVKTSVMITCNTVHKVEPPYPAIAKAARAGGLVKVAVKVDRQGRVMSAEAVEGHPLLREISRAAALKWTFDPDPARKEEVSGTINFNFILTDEPPLSAPQKTPALSPAERRFENGKKLAKDSQYNAAITAFKDAIRLEPKYAWAYYELGMVQHQTQQFAPAEKSCATARDLRLAELKAEQSGEQDMLYENALMCLGMTAAVTHKYDEAINYFRKVAALEKGMFNVRSMLGTVLFYKGDYNEAEKALKEGLALKPDHVVSLYSLGEVHLAQQRWQDAVDVFKKCMGAEDGPFVPPSHYGLGIAYLRSGNREAAMQEYQALKQINNSEKAELLLQEINRR
ncbi:MAG: tetratricopeptide repeat protein [Blastocatellia bacterium]